MARLKRPPRATFKMVADLVAVIDELGWTYQAIEKASGVPQAYISRLRSGKNFHFSAPLLFFIAESLGYEFVLVKKVGRPRVGPKIVALNNGDLKTKKPSGLRPNGFSQKEPKPDGSRSST